ncbi:MAG: hypothetical protein ACJ761_02730 [Chloroflexota bacterium]
MTATASIRRPASVPRHALRRGTRGFAAVVLFLTGLIVLAVAVFVLPASNLPRLALTWLIPLTLAFAIAHGFAIYGIVRRRPWSVPLTLYVAAVGIGVSAYGILLLLTRLDPFAATGATSTGPTGVGFLTWMIASWIVAARFVLVGMAAPELRPRPSTEAPKAIATAMAGAATSPRLTIAAQAA